MFNFKEIYTVRNFTFSFQKVERKERSQQNAEWRKR